MTLDHEDIAAIAAQVAQLLAPMLAGAGKASPSPTPDVPQEEEPGQVMDDREFVLLMSQPNLLKAIREREKRLREARPRKTTKKRKVA